MTSIGHQTYFYQCDRPHKIMHLKVRMNAGRHCDTCRYARVPSMHTISCRESNRMQIFIRIRRSHGILIEFKQCWWLGRVRVYDSIQRVNKWMNSNCEWITRHLIRSEWHFYSYIYIARIYDRNLVSGKTIAGANQIVASVHDTLYNNRSKRYDALRLLCGALAIWLKDNQIVEVRINLLEM